MLDPLRSFAAIVFVFGVVVFVHELGHFLAAKAVGVYAPRFAIGFWRPVWSRKWGETEYVINILPLGGYVRMASREDEVLADIEGGGETGGPDAAGDTLAPAPGRPRYWDPNGIAPFGPRPVPERRLLESKPLPARLLIMFAGVAMNLLLGFVVLSGVYLIYGKPGIPTRTIGAVNRLANAPQLGQLLHPGDTITAVNGIAVANWGDIDRTAVATRVAPLRLRTQRGEVVIAVGGAGQPTARDVVGALDPYLPPVFGDVLAGRAAERAGLMPGDSVEAVDGRPVSTWSQLVDVVRVSARRPLRLIYARLGRQREAVVTPEALTEQSPRGGARQTVGKIGAAPRPLVEYRRASLGDAVALGGRETLYLTGEVLATLRKLFTGAASPRELGGIIQIGKASAQAAREGFDQLLRLLAFISVNLAVFNLLPIPLLDGGQIVVNVAEAARGREFSDRTRQLIAYAGLSTIILLVVFALFNDLTRNS
jgi:regulator of sigma E protease